MKEEYSILWISRKYDIHHKETNTCRPQNNNCYIILICKVRLK